MESVVDMTPQERPGFFIWLAVHAERIPGVLWWTSIGLQLVAIYIQRAAQ